MARKTAIQARSEARTKTARRESLTAPPHHGLVTARRMHLRVVTAIELMRGVRKKREMRKMRSREMRAANKRRRRK